MPRIHRCAPAFCTSPASLSPSGFSCLHHAFCPGARRFTCAGQQSVRNRSPVPVPSTRTPQLSATSAFFVERFSSYTGGPPNELTFWNFTTGAESSVPANRPYLPPSTRAQPRPITQRTLP
jgi:hypothetical protein